ncbi:MAG: Glycosyl transferase group 1 [Candidatus Woesebacteria bacterium GW2011_GWA1_33_30]|uniref:Glycosyl transferase group 1 n=1 Tax=Candidatus Woesebacteria bacterium GW2011_GWA2_33_28 TaxID=1618561 RepID=A0A0F9ZVX6_9BACT|nr:MAG: Glycosyl transferase group 1 [Candidatus Woesebacteria bacterium GW2011_GWA2_33_28]KKP49131.1 MAG: Glycosyl transferase group 1 [Candidatus Woesebacteria bacterium GW2011_GWA1_33_30]KKP50269.1 MAG: Glycosyl transferase group 1 [Microgenomates group bacterium GW2011_GWC1_33_32]KKP52722.1 MAG: Glycosyl transferase group 1 [Candidatus Woesebacteria bacterium GW2011_GWB1_33_38]
MNGINLDNLKIALVYDRVNKFGGAERVLLSLHEMFPNAPLYTSVYNELSASWAHDFPKIYTTFLQKIPFLKNNHELIGWLMPLAFETFDFSNYDLVISVTSEAAKGIITGTNTLHVCYCLTPTRYLWSARDFYFNNPPKKFNIFPFFKIFAKPFVGYLEKWDSIASTRPDKMIAISTEVKSRIKKYYKRNSEIIYPPCDLPRKVMGSSKGKYYFIHGRFEPYKRLDLVIDVFNDLELRLVVSGSGSEFLRLQRKANQNIKFVYKPSDNQLPDLYKNAMAFLMPQEEDFGITSVEAQSFGVPVIAYNKGGAIDTVIPDKTGVLFNSQTKEILKQAIAKFDTMRFNNIDLINNAKIFSKERFKRELQRSLVRSYLSWRWGDKTLA